MKWFWIILAILYVLSPYDLIPGIAPFPSRIDDLVVLILLFRYLARKKRESSAGGQTNGEQQWRVGDDQHAHGRESPRSDARAKSPHEILGVTPGAGRDEIRAAYRKLANQYHPDKVAHLGKEFQEMAENRFKEIQQAYDRLIKQR